MGDEIGNDAAATSRRTRALVAGLVATAVVVAGVVALRRGVDPVVVRPPASPPAAQMPSLPGQLGPSPSGPPPVSAVPAVPVSALLVREVCRPLRTDGRSRLDVAFTLLNTLPRPVTLLRITPVFPLPGLRPLGTEYRAGSCAAPGPALRTGDVRGGGTLLVVLRLGLPPTCPAPYPVEAELTERRDGRTVTTGLHLLSDLGDVPFTTC
jgi:hypothetical protein